MVLQSNEYFHFTKVKNQQGLKRNLEMSSRSIIFCRSFFRNSNGILSHQIAHSRLVQRWYIDARNGALIGRTLHLRFVRVVVGPSIPSPAVLDREGSVICENSEQLIPLKKVPVYLQKLIGERKHISTIYRWVNKGIHGVRPDTITIGGTRYTSAEGLSRFFKESTESSEEVFKSGLTAPAEAQRKTQLEATAEELGI